jgi:transposase
LARIRYQQAVGHQVKRGRPAIGKKPDRKELKRLYVREALSIREISDILGCSKDMVSRALKQYRIEARPKVKRSVLRKHDLKDLEARVKEKRIRGTARDLGIDESTLRHYLKKSKNVK